MKSYNFILKKLYICINFTCKYVKNYYFIIQNDINFFEIFILKKNAVKNINIFLQNLDATTFPVGSKILLS